MEFRIGCQSWGYEDWITTAGGETVFYPRGTRQQDMLGLYSLLLDTVEVDSTAYGPPAASTLVGWAEKVPDQFLFSLKVPRLVTHEFGLDHRSMQLMLEFCERARLLKDRLGMILIQFPARFKAADDTISKLLYFVDEIPSDLKFAVEFREPGWFTEKLTADLKERGIALAMVDGPWVDREVMFNCLPRLSTKDVYIRLMGKRDLEQFDRIYRDRTEVIELWVERIKALTAERVFIYVDNYFEGNSPATISRLRSLLGESPVDASELERQTSLF